jgi:hypothetical protein
VKWRSEQGLTEVQNEKESSMQNECDDMTTLRYTHADAYMAGRHDRARQVFDQIRDHEKVCPKCKALARGTGLAGGLFRGAMVVEGSEVEG